MAEKEKRFEDALAVCAEYGGVLGFQIRGGSDDLIPLEAADTEELLAAVLVRSVTYGEGLARVEVYPLNDGGVGEPLISFLLRAEELEKLIDDPVMLQHEEEEDRG